MVDVLPKVTTTMPKNVSTNVAPKRRAPQAHLFDHHALQGFPRSSQWPRQAARTTPGNRFVFSFWAGGEDGGAGGGYGVARKDEFTTHRLWFKEKRNHRSLSI